MKEYICEICSKSVDKQEGIAVIVRNNSKYVKGYIVHKNECDIKLEQREGTRAGELNANSSMELKIFNTDNDIERYLNTGLLDMF